MVERYIIYELGSGILNDILMFWQAMCALILIPVTFFL